jgi:ABC-2 type transport system permease protein
VSRTGARAVWAVVRRDLQVVRGSKPVVIPMAIVTVVLLVLVPLGLVVGARLAGDGVDLSDLGPLLALLPEDVVARVEADPAAGLIEVGLVHLLAPLLLLVPLIVANAIAADAIAGERERRTLEGLLVTPLRDGELFLAKTLAAWLPALVLGVVGGVLYAVVGELAALGVVEHRMFPNAAWAAYVLWVGPATAAIGLGVGVLVSARVQTVQEAFQISGVVVLPVVAMIVGQAVGLVLLSPAVLLLVGAVLWLLAGGVLVAGARSVRRTRLGERL